MKCEKLILEEEKKKSLVALEICDFKMGSEARNGWEPLVCYDYVYDNFMIFFSDTEK